MSKKNELQASGLLLHFLVATFKNSEETGNEFNVFSVIRYIRILSFQCVTHIKYISEIFHFLVLRFLILVCILKHI